jgi:serine/threonine-protein kinase HipA
VNDRLVVLLGDRVAGELTRTGSTHAFTYDHAYRSRPEPTPLSLSMPVPVRHHTDQTVTPWLWGLLPDNDRVLQRWAERLRALRLDATTWLGADFTGRFSLAGAQAKTALVRDGARWGLPEGSQATSHILKP